MDTRDLLDELDRRVRAAAFASSAHRRGWEAVRAAALLRGQGEPGRALALLDDVVARFDYEDVVRAAYTCAVAIHCDLGEPGTAISAGERIWALAPSIELGNALVRAYWERYEQTGDLADRAAWQVFRRELEALGAPVF